MVLTSHNQPDRVLPNASSDSPGTGAPMEKEMARSEQWLVDNAFDEGQYDTGISILQSRPRFSVLSRSHIRQLLYIALYPFGNSKSTLTHDPALLTKLASTKHNASALVPSPSASAAALEALFSSVKLNSPASLLCALPSYPAIDVQRYASPGHDLDDKNAAESDSAVAKAAMCFRVAKDCWHILKEGFVPPLDPVVPTIPGSPRKRNRSHSARSALIDDAPPQLVGSKSWAILDWFLCLFEADQRLTEQTTGAHYSPLLLTQIPPTRSANGGKWAANVPVDIAFHCLEQEDFSRRRMGMRLLLLLINLTTTPLFDLPLFVNIVVTHLPSDHTRLTELFALLPPRFEFALCQALLATPSATPHTSRARPQPRARRQSDRESRVLASTPSVDAGAPLPPASEILHLVVHKAKGGGQSAVAKFHLIKSYAELQCASAGEQSADWRAMRADGRLRTAVEAAFDATDTESLCIRDDLLAMVGA